MKKVIISTALVLALSVPAIAATTTTAVPVAATPTTDMAKQSPVKGGDHKQVMTKEEWLSKIEAKKAKVVAASAAAKLDDAAKALVDSALARVDRWVETIKGYKEEGTSYARSAVRAMNELGWVQSIVHHKDPYPAEKVAKLMAEFETLKAKAATLTGDMKAAADTMIANTQSVADDLAKHKETEFMSQLVHGLHKEFWAFKRFVHKAAHKEPVKATTTAPVTPAAVTTVAPAPAAGGSEKPKSKS